MGVGGGWREQLKEVMEGYSFSFFLFSGLWYVSWCVTESAHPNGPLMDLYLFVFGATQSSGSINKIFSPKLIPSNQTKNLTFFPFNFCVS